MTKKRTLSSPKGLYFEEYEVGMTVTSAGRTITEADVVAFAGFSGDWTPIHTDSVYAAEHFFGQRVAHGMLVLAVASGLAARLGFLDETFLAFRSINEWKFAQPVFLGDTLHVRLNCSETRAMQRLGGGIVTLEIEVINQTDQVVQRGRWSLLIKSQPE